MGPVTLFTLGSTSILLLLLGVTLLVGFGADWLANRFRIPDVLWLIALGILAGPVLGLLPESDLLLLAPVLGTAALVLILFDAGIDLDLFLLRPLARSAILSSALCYFASTAVLSLVGALVLFPGHPILSILFGAALGCTSGAVVIPLAARFGFPGGIRGVLQLDAALEDAIAIVMVTTLLALVTPVGGALAIDVTTALILPFPVGIAVGLIAGLAWLPFLYRWQDRPFATLATLGFLFVAYAAAQGLGGSGIVAALVFGVVIGNEVIVRRFLRRARPFRVSAELRRVEVEIAFVLRTFFLVMIGVLVTLAFPSLAAGVAIALVVVALLLVRYGAFRLVADAKTFPESWATPLAAMYGRGLTSAVLLIVSLRAIPNSAILFFPALLLIVGTNVGMTVAMYASRPMAEYASPFDTGEDAGALLIAFSPENLIPGPMPAAGTGAGHGGDPSSGPGRTYVPPPLPSQKKPPT